MEPSRGPGANDAAQPPSPEANDADAPEEEEERLCRFCFEGGEAGELISPCSCAGGQKYVHLKCLRWWQRTVLVSQPTHPDLYDIDTRQRICNVCKAEFSCPPPTRAELLASFTGPELAALIDEGCMIGSAREFSAELEQQLANFPESAREATVCRNWVRGVFLIVKVKEHREQECLLRVSDAAALERLASALADDGRSLHLRGRRFLVLPQGPLRGLPEDASGEQRRAAVRALGAPTELRLRPDRAPGDCGDDGIMAVNLTRAVDPNASNSSYLGGKRGLLHVAVDEALGDGEELLAEVTHFRGGPCEEQKVSACIVLPGGRRHSAVTGPDCLMVGIRAAQAMAKGEAFVGEEGEELMAAPRGDEDAEQAPGDGPASKRRRVDGSAEPPDAAMGEAAAASGACSSSSPSRRPVRLYVVWGYAGWSRCQLMGEIARGSWGLCHTMPGDVSGIPPEELWEKVYPRLIFAPKNEMSESYGGQQPEAERRRLELRRLAILHDLLRRSMARGQRRPLPSPQGAARGVHRAAEAGDDADAEAEASSTTSCSEDEGSASSPAGVGEALAGSGAEEEERCGEGGEEEEP